MAWYVVAGILCSLVEFFFPRSLVCFLFFFFFFFFFVVVVEVSKLNFCFFSSSDVLFFLLF